MALYLPSILIHIPLSRIWKFVNGNLIFAESYFIFTNSLRNVKHLLLYEEREI